MYFDIKKFCYDLQLTQSKFALFIQESQPTVSLMVKGARSIKPKHIERLRSKYGDVDDNYITADDDAPQPQPLRPTLDTSLTASGVPYYNVDFCGGFDFLFNDQTITPSGKINLPQYDKAECWVNVTGRSMEPTISNGDIIALRRVNDWQTYLLYGEVYGIMTDEWRTIKRVRRAANPDNILLEPLNSEFDTQEIPRSIVRQVWQVVGVLKKFF